jgi:hypothetical protein
MVAVMSPSEAPIRRGNAPILFGGLTAVLAIGVAVFALRGANGSVAVPAPGLDTPVDAAGLAREGHRVVPAVLSGIYAAFAETEEGAIYDGLAAVAAGEALEALYLERAGALATGGLPDQVVHELSLLSGSWRADSGKVLAEVRWAVLGEVGHAEHTHIRGNAYGADLEMTTTEAGWRLTGFDLTEVDRSDVGTLTIVADDAGAPAG